MVDQGQSHVKLAKEIYGKLREADLRLILSLIRSRFKKRRS